jgi:signal transduction histidine kinase
MNVSSTPWPDASAALPAEDRQWRRGVRATGLVVAAATVVASVGDIGSSAGVALLMVVTALWLVELFATPADVRAEAALLLVIGFAGAALEAAAAESAGFLFAYFAAAAMGLRLPPRVAAVAVGLVAVAMAVAVVARHGDHTATSVTIDVLGVAFAGSVAAATRSARAASLRSAELVVELENSRAAQAEAAALAERARLAREIHDVLAHSLSGQIMSLEAASVLAERTGADARVRDQIDRSRQLAKNGLSETRQAISALRGESLPGPALLPDLVRDASRAHGISAQLAAHGEQRPLTPEAGLTLYRTAQEALTNTAKHAGAGATAWITLTWYEDRVELEAVDARSEAEPVPMHVSGYGLTGLRERAELAGGSLTTGPEGSGFAVRLTLPYAGDGPQ